MIRRRTVPSFVGLSLLDVLCCSLGAFIFFMLVVYWDRWHQARAYREAEHRAQTGSSRLATTQEALSEAFRRTQLLEEALASSQAQRADLLSRSHAQKKELDHLYHRLAKIEDALGQARQQIVTQTKELGSQSDRIQELVRQVSAFQKARAGLEKELGQLDARHLETLHQLQLVTAQWQRSESRLVQAMESLSQRDQAALSARDQLQAQEKTLARLQSLLAEKHKELVLAQREQSDMRRRLDQTLAELAEVRSQQQALRKAAQAEDRFAGIELSARRALFLIDISGSMGSLDNSYPDSRKWPTVVTTILHVMRSLPRLEQYQVILFNHQIQYLLGGAGQWRPYDPSSSPEQLEKALLAVKPDGTTNLYRAFEEALKYRAQGLEAVYLFSDGLPTDGPLPPDVERQKRLSDAEKTVLLTQETLKYIRRRNTNPTVPIHAIGFYCASENLGAFLWSVARDSGGSFVGMSRP